MTDEELQHLLRLLDVTKRRRDALQLQAAHFGPSRVPADVTIEIQECEESIQRLDAKIRIVTVPMIIQEATGPEASIDVLRMHIKQLGEQMGTMWRYLEHMILEDRGITDEWRKQQTYERQVGARKRVAIEILFAVGIGIAIYLAWR